MALRIFYGCLIFFAGAAIGALATEEASFGVILALVAIVMLVAFGASI